MRRKIIDDFKFKNLNDLFDINLIFYHPSGMLQLSQFVWTLRYSVQVVFNNFLVVDATDWSKISSDQKRLFFAVSLYPLSFFTNTPFKGTLSVILSDPPCKDGNARFTMVALKSYSGQKCGRSRRFTDSATRKVFIFRFFLKTIEMRKWICKWKYTV